MYLIWKVQLGWKLQQEIFKFSYKLINIAVTSSFNYPNHKKDIDTNDEIIMNSPQLRREKCK